MTKTILAVDDNNTILTLYTTLSRHNPNYNLITINNPIDCLRIIQGQSIDLLITDLVMPEMDGLDLISKAYRLRPNAKFMLCTSSPEYEVQPLLEDMKERGIEVVYLPPSALWSTEKLLKMVKEVIGE